MLDIFSRPDLFYNLKPVYDAVSLLNDAEKILRVLLKPIVDLTCLPRLEESHRVHGDLNSLKKELNSFIVRIICYNITLTNNDRRRELLDCLANIILRIDAMQTFIDGLAPSSQSESIYNEKLSPMVGGLKIEEYAHEIWGNIFSSLHYRDKISVSGVCKALRQGPIADSYVSARALAQKDFYTEHHFEMSVIQIAYKKTLAEGKVLNISTEGQFRKVFRTYINDLVSGNTKNKLESEITAHYKKVAKDNNEKSTPERMAKLQVLKVMEAYLKGECYLNDLQQIVTSNPGYRSSSFSFFFMSNTESLLHKVITFKGGKDCEKSFTYKI